MRIGRRFLTFAFTAALAAAGAPCTFGVDLIGYVPNYRMSDSNYVNNVLPAQLAMLDEVRYFGISVTTSGGLTTTSTNLSHLQTIQQKIAALPADKRPRLGVTLGGAGLSAGFSAVAQSDSLRSQLALNVNSLLTQTGAVGVDIDWEHPAEGIESTTYYPALLARVKQELGASRRVYATVSPEKMAPRSSFDGPNGLDGVSIMTYDLGWWANDALDPNLGQHSLHEYVEDTVEAWTNPTGTFIPRFYVWGSKRSIDAPEDKLGVGSSFYARGYDGTNPNTAVEYRALGAPWTTTDGNAYQNGSTKVWLPGKSCWRTASRTPSSKDCSTLFFGSCGTICRPPTPTHSCARRSKPGRRSLGISPPTA